MPLAPLATVVPIAERSYFTVAWVAEVSLTESTVDVTADASGLDEKALIEDENSEPFCSNRTRSLFGVEELKNVFQSAVISEMAVAVPALGEGPTLADGPTLGGTAGADCAVGCTGDGAAEYEPWAY